MDWITILGSATTLASFVIFVGIVVWAYSGRRRAAFAAAANAPFALPEDACATVDEGGFSTERQP